MKLALKLILTTQLNMFPRPRVAGVARVMMSVTVTYQFGELPILHLLPHPSHQALNC